MIFCFFADFSALALLLESLVAGVARGPFSPSCFRFFLLDLGVLIADASWDAAFARVLFSSELGRGVSVFLEAGTPRGVYLARSPSG